MCSHSDLSPEGYWPADCALKGPTTDTFIAHTGLPPEYSHICKTPWSVFQDGENKTILSASRAHSDYLSLLQDQWNKLTLQRSHLLNHYFTHSTNWCWPQSCHSAPAVNNRRNITQHYTGFIRFHFSNFRYSLTLFSKFFASFPHGTCALSVSHQYLALEGIYLQIWSSIPRKSTRWSNMLRLINLDKNGSFTLSAALYQGTWSRTINRCHLFRPQFGVPPREVTQIHNMSWIPLQSPLLGESQLVSFPPLNYMLKFSGYSYLIWDPITSSCHSEQQNINSRDTSI